ncbi:MAG: hypothetical protein IPF41_11435 [Flavobacteriales bacterium]|nr:hypothetical protein [Flavobacteriales bacterium]
MGLFMVCGFLLIYLARDFSPDKEAWIASDGNGPHFAARLAHVRTVRLPQHRDRFSCSCSAMPARQHRTIAWLALLGMLMPVGILLEIYPHALAHLPVLPGAVLIVLAVVLLGLYFLCTRRDPFHENCPHCIAITAAMHTNAQDPAARLATPPPTDAAKFQNTLVLNNGTPRRWCSR